MPRLSVHILGGGERVPMLHDHLGLPLFYPTLFATTQLRNAGSAVNTIRNKLADIVVLLRWESHQSRNLEMEFERAQFLTLADVVALRDYAKLDMRHEGWPEATPHGACPASKLSLLEASIKAPRSLPSVGSQQHFNRLTTIAEYLGFLATALTQHTSSRSKADDISRMVKMVRSHRPRGLHSRHNQNLPSPSPADRLVGQFMELGAEDEKRSPFRDPDIRLRNAIIFGLLRHTGMRRGELLSLRIDQFDLGHEPRVWIRRNHDDRHDSRPYQPVAKTKERVLPIPSDLAKQIQRYILQARSKITPARRHPYLLVAHHKGRTWGQPLSTSALNSQIFGQMRAANPALQEIHPHSFRHHFNHEFSARVDEHNHQVAKGTAEPGSIPISEAREMDIRAYLNGHRDKASGYAYMSRHIRAASDRAIRGIQESIALSKIDTEGADGAD